MKKDKSFTNENLIPVSKFYADAEKLGFTIRTLRWYVTEGIFPKPIHIGKEAYYDLSKCPIYDYIHIIGVLRDSCNFSLPDIKQVLDHYKNKKENIELLSSALEVVEKEYQKRSVINFKSYEKWLRQRRMTSFTIEKIRNKFYKAIHEGKNIRKISLIEIENEVRKEEEAAEAKELEEWS